MTTHKGKVKWFNNSKGFGFITPDNAEIKELFVHYSYCREGNKFLDANDRVVFVIKETERGPEAHDVMKVGAA